MSWRSADVSYAFALRQAVALAIHLQDVDVVGEPVQQGPGQPLAAQGFGALVERQVAGHQRGATLGALAEALEQQLRATLGEGHEAEFVDGQQPVAGQLLLQAQQPLLVARLQEFVHQGGPHEATPTPHPSRCRFEQERAGGCFRPGLPGQCA
jgi:hypothetical protein